MKINILDNRITENMLTPVTLGSAGIDLRASIEEPITIYNQDQAIIPTGIKVAIHDLWVGMIYPRSGLGVKHGIVLGNGTGVIDSDYRGEVMVCLWNRNSDRKPFEINPMDRIAQLVVIPHYSYSFITFTDELDNTLRGNGGFGSTGVS